MTGKPAASPFHVHNVRMFLYFRVFFNARFYYPVFTVLFIDFGLSVEQFALMNAVWAASIVLLEVPSGALADTIGRRNLLIAAGALMVAEMSLLCFVPRGNATLLFAVFIVNRILSGAAEAAASGADEAIAYDALAAEGDINDWDRVMERQAQVRAIGSFVALNVGAVVYDPAAMQRIADFAGLQVTFTQAVTLRFPLFLALFQAALTFLTTLRMRETEKPRTEETQKGYFTDAFKAFKTTLSAGRWILKTPFALIVILAGLMFDNIIRMFMTLNSQYYRLIEIPEAMFGLVGSLMALVGMIVPRAARLLLRRFSPRQNLLLLSLLTGTGLFGLTFFIPYGGVLPAVFLYSAMVLMTIFVSYYLNRITGSKQRATVLSFKGLSFNLAYGLAGILYSTLLFALRPGISTENPGLSGVSLENRLFIESIGWFPGYFLATFLIFILFARRRLQETDRDSKIL